MTLSQKIQKTNNIVTNYICVRDISNPEQATPPAFDALPVA